MLRDELYDPRPFVPRPILRPAFADKDTISATLRLSEAALEPITDLFSPECLEPQSLRSGFAEYLERLSDTYMLKPGRKSGGRHG